MYEDKITVEIDIRERVDVNIEVSDIIHALNELPLTRKWSAVGNILTNLHIDGKWNNGEEINEGDKLTDEQKQIIKSFLEKQLQLL